MDHIPVFLINIFSTTNIQHLYRTTYLLYDNFIVCYFLKENNMLLPAKNSPIQLSFHMSLLATKEGDLFKKKEKFYVGSNMFFKCAIIETKVDSEKCLKFSDRIQ